MKGELPEFQLLLSNQKKLTPKVGADDGAVALLAGGVPKLEADLPPLHPPPLQLEVDPHRPDVLLTAVPVHESLKKQQNVWFGAKNEP